MDQGARAQQRVGQVLREKLRIEAVIGVGGMAAVYAATHRNSKRVAVKMLHAELSMHSELRARFLREGYAANQVDHPGAVAVLDDDVSEDGSVFLVMELLEGETVAGRADRRGGTLDAAEVLAVADQLLDVLVAAHSKQIIHRDLKPENLFVTREGRVKVLDFGIASMRVQSTDARITATGASAMGTPAFMPPEQARARWAEVDQRSDLWAVGASLFTLSTGRSVHEAETLNELLLQAMTKPAPRLRAVMPDAPRQLAEVIDKALAFDPRDRWQDARAMQVAVRAAFRAVTGTEGPPPLLPPVEGTAETAKSRSLLSAPAERPRADRRLALGIAAVAFALTLGGAALLLLRKPEPEKPGPEPRLPDTTTSRVEPSAPVVAPAETLAPTSTPALKGSTAPSATSAARPLLKPAPPRNPFDRRN